MFVGNSVHISVCNYINEQKLLFSQVELKSLSYWLRQATRGLD